MIGTDIGGYRIISELAEGGMGVVYRGESIDDGTPVAIKFLRKDLKDAFKISFCIQRLEKKLRPNCADLQIFDLSNVWQ